MFRSISSVLLLLSALMVGMRADADSLGKEVGSAVYSFGPFKIYEATLSSASGEYVPGQPFALTLEYFRSMSAERIADVSIEEMARLGDMPKNDLEPLREQLERCFGDVSSGDTLKGVWESRDVAVFYRNMTFSCRVDHPSFSENFFSIWLGANSRFPQKANKLMKRKL